MAFVAHVLTDLAGLSAETRRKNQEVRSAIENAQVLAKTLPASAQLSQSSEIQKVFCAPFLLSLESGNSKLVSTALSPLVRLASSNSLIDADVASIVTILYKLDIATCPVETQLKILQVLPTLVSGYSLESANFVRLVAISSRLASSSNVVVSNTASATLQQIFSALFEGLKAHQASSDAPKTEVTIRGVSDAETREFSLDELELRCFHVVSDLSHAFLGTKLTYFTDRDIRFRPEAALEILENILALNQQVFEIRQELSAVLKMKTVPGLLNTLNSTSPQYSMILRTLRISLLLISYQIDDLSEENELILASTNHILLDDSTVTASDDFTNAPSFLSHPYWEKSLVIEAYRSVFSNFDILRTLYDTFDSNTKRKNVLREVFVVMNTLLGNGYAALFKNRTIQVLSDKNSGPVLAKNTAMLKTPMLDHLDRSEPPSAIPELYAPFLIFRSLLAFADGVATFVANISADANAETIENDVDFITSLNESVFAEVFELFKKFLFCSMDSDSFHMIVRALQKYTHAIGLLGLSSARDELLSLLAESIVKNSSPEDSKKSGSSNLLALGESLVESLSNTIQPPFTSSSSSSSGQKSELQSEDHVSVQGKHNISRSFNSRQVICLRAFTNLAVSLGSTLQDSWKIVWATLQWVDYFIEGPDEHSGIPKDSKNSGESRLSPQDLSGIKNSLDKLLESFAEYQYEPFFEAFSVLTKLYYDESDESADLCPLNKNYILKMIISLSTLDFKTFDFLNSDLWTLTSDFFEQLAIDRNLAHPKRSHIVECYTSIIDVVTRKGFKNENDTANVAEKSLNSLHGFLEKLLGLGRAEELMILSCETEMHLTVLETLHKLIDDYDKFYQNSWELVFKILRTAFVNTEDQTVQSAKLVEKIVMLISTSFESLKMILDEFLATLPFNQLKSLIDTLLNFCSQKYDLNISFSSVSYFWLISDCINSSIAKNEQDVNSYSSLRSIGDMQSLENLLQKSTTGSAELYKALNIYLLAKLSHLSTDERNQVREGAIQTLFQILDVQGHEVQSWDLIYHIVFPELLDLANLESSKGNFSKKDILSSLNLVLSGLVSVYAKFMMDFSSGNHFYEKFWTRFVEYMSAMLKMRWLELNSKVFQSFQDILLSLRVIEMVPKFISRLLFDFWISVPIEYDFVKPEYQESLALLNESFKDLYLLIREDFEIAEASQVLGVLNKCARYPVLKPGVNDSTKPTKLQKIVVENLILIDKEGDGEEISAAIIQQLAQISAYPYEVRGRIEAKLKSKFEGKLKIPTFVAVGQLAFESICPKLAGMKHLNVFLYDDRFHRIMSDLLDIVRNNAQGVKEKDTAPLCVRCNDLILNVIKRLVDENLADFAEKPEIWEVLLECIMATFNEGYDEMANVKQYEALSAVILPVLFQSEQEHLIKMLIQQVYYNSYLYKANATENELMNGGDDFETLTNYHFDESFGTTVKLEVENNRQIRVKCLNELFRIASTEGTSAEFARQFVAIRAAFSIRRFIADGRLSGHRPLPQIQEDELLEILQGFASIGQKLDATHMKGLMRLLTQSVVYADRIPGMKDVVQSALQLGIV